MGTAVPGGAGGARARHPRGHAPSQGPPHSGMVPRRGRVGAADPDGAGGARARHARGQAPS